MLLALHTSDLLLRRTGLLLRPPYWNTITKSNQQTKHGTFHCYTRVCVTSTSSSY